MKTFKRFLEEAKQEENLSPLDKEDIRNMRTTGSTSFRDRQTGIRRTIHAASRGAKYSRDERDEYRGDRGNIPDTEEGIRQRIEFLKGRMRGRMFSRMVRGDLSHPESRAIKDEIQKKLAQQHIDVANSGNKIKKFNR